jgi:hypothetical protein
MVKHRYIKQGPDACLRQIGDAELLQHRVCDRVANGEGAPEIDTVVGLEVVDRDTARRRWQEPVRAQVGELGEIRPLEGGDS